MTYIEIARFGGNSPRQMTLSYEPETGRWSYDTMVHGDAGLSHGTAEDITAERALQLVANALEDARLSDRVDASYRIPPRRVAAIESALLSVGINPATLPPHTLRHVQVSFD